MPAFIRPSRYGGFSICRSPEELVGRGRCHHLTGPDRRGLLLQYDEKDRCHYVDLGPQKPSTKEIKHQEQEIRSFLDRIQKERPPELSGEDIISKII